MASPKRAAACAMLWVSEAVDRRRGQRLEAAAARCAFHHGEDGVVVDDPVYQQDRRLGSVDVVVEKPALFWVEASEIVTAPPAARVGDETVERIHHHVSCSPRRPRSPRPDAIRGQSSVRGAWESRRRYASIGTGPHDQILPSSRFGVVESDAPSSPPSLQRISAANCRGQTWP